MLNYHFGSRDGLLAAVVGRIEAEQRDALAGLPVGDDPLATGRAFWARLSDPALAPAERLFFEIYVAALRAPDWADGFRATVIDAWERPLTEAFGHLPDGRIRARLGIAVIRGLLLDLLLTGDHDTTAAANDLFTRLITAPG